MPYRLKLSKEVQHEIDRLPGNMRQRVRRSIAELAANPRPSAAKALEGDLTGYYRLRLDDYRIIYTIEDDVLIVTIIRVAKRTPRTYTGLN
jgi:mRNA interferase RelE/StbE